jgi:hypothetical protein
MRGPLTEEHKRKISEAMKAKARRKKNGQQKKKKLNEFAASYVRNQCKDQALAALENGHVDLAQAWAKAGKGV